MSVPHLTKREGQDATKQQQNLSPLPQKIMKKLRGLYYSLRLLQVDFVPLTRSKQKNIALPNKIKRGHRKKPRQKSLQMVQKGDA